MMPIERAMQTIRLLDRDEALCPENLLGTCYNPAYEFHFGEHGAAVGGPGGRGDRKRFNGVSGTVLSSA